MSSSQVLERVRTLWQQHEGSKFPGGFTGSVGGQNFFVLSVEIGTHVLTFVDGGGKLLPHRVSLLKQHVSGMRDGLQAVGSKPGTEYFERLIVMGDMIVSLCSEQPSAG